MIFVSMPTVAKVLVLHSTFKLNISVITAEYIVQYKAYSNNKRVP